MMNGYGPPQHAPPAYPYPAPPQQNGFYQAPPAAAGNMVYPYPTAAAGTKVTHLKCDVWTSDSTEGARDKSGAVSATARLDSTLSISFLFIFVFFVLSKCNRIP